jgi:cyanophycinase
MRTTILLLFAFISVCSNGQTEQFVTKGPEKGHLIIVGGNMTDPAIYAKFMELSGGPDANIVIIVTAGNDEYLHDKGGLEYIEKRFSENGFENFTILHTRDPKEADKEEFIKPIKEASGLWFTGGRQWRLVDAYAGTKTLEEIYYLLDRGGVIGGSSAGASIQGSFLVRGDTKTNVVMMGDHQEGFGFLTNSAIDQHLLALNRQFDIFEILEAHPHLLGIGLDENTAIVVHDDEFEVIGQSFVAIYDGTFCQFVRDKADWSIERPEITPLPEGSERFYLLGAGRRYSLTRRRVIE